MTSSLVGSEMCIRDSECNAHHTATNWDTRYTPPRHRQTRRASLRRHKTVSYTHLTLPTICSV
eukprot:11959318-Prorocentrum_lima.AAC.1